MPKTLIAEENEHLEANASSLREQGLTYRAIGKELHVSEATVRRKLKAPAEENGRNGEHGNGHVKREHAPVSDALTSEELLRRVRVAASSEDPAVIVPLLARLRTRHDRLGSLVAREKQNAETASKAIEKLAVLVAEKDRPEDEAKLATARADLASATALATALQKELALLHRPIAELTEASEKRQASTNERQQNMLLTEAHRLIEAAQREFFRQMDEATACIRQAEAIGKSWNEHAQSYRLPTEFTTRGIEAMRDTCTKITALTAKGEPIATVKVKLGPHISYQQLHGGEIAKMPAFQARHMVEEHPEYQCEYVETVEH